MAAVVALAAAALLAACTGRRVYDTYQHTPTTGWEKNDTLTFCVPGLLVSGNYEASLGLRINEIYPFTAVTLIVQQRVFPSGRLFTDTLNCPLVGGDGNYSGKGVSYYQYRFPVRTLSLSEGDSLQVSVRHDMKREILPGISDIGFMLSRP